MPKFNVRVFEIIKIRVDEVEGTYNYDAAQGSFIDDVSHAADDVAEELQKFVAKIKAAKH